ncbi:MAG: protein phosphatase 2C domain-containing protein [Bacteroidetes bacterium]|nr:protein phosphatase 2C domain-containing protein [Bacteroidota bacterium]
MKISIKQPVALHEAGGKEVNEDFIFPLQGQANVEEKLFIIADGEGGPNAGEVASKLVALSFAKFFASTPPSGNINLDYLKKALSTSEQAISAYKEAHPESSEMATTLSLVHFGENQVTLAWVGNSYIFHYESVTKSLKSYHGNNDILIRGSETPANLNMHAIPVDTIRPADYFFLATDGILEQVDQNTLETIFINDQNPEPKLLVNEIHNLSQSFTQDNYSCYLIQIKNVGSPTGGAATAGTINPNINEADDSEEDTDDDRGPKMLKNLVYGAFVLIILCLIAFAWWTATRPSLYDNLMARGDQNLEMKKYRLAISQFDSAFVATDDQQKKEIANKRKTETIARRDQSFDEDEPIELLIETAEFYYEKGNDYYDRGNFRDAIRNYRRAERVKERDGDKLPEIPQDRIATAYIHLGDQMYEGESQDCNLAVNLYNKAFKILESPEITLADKEQFDRAQTRKNECTELLSKAMEEKTEGEKTTLATENEDPKKSESTTSPTENQIAQNTDNTNKREANTDNTTTTKTRSLNETKTETASQPEATRRTGLTQPTQSPEKAAELEKYLATGKRLFVKARSSESGYEYRTSADNLENAMPNLDGPGAYMLAFMYHSGLGVDKDETKALKYAQISALKGWAAGQYLYGHILLLRQYPRDSVTAIQSLTKAADQNYLDAINRLSELNQ